jgi:hypothetical protein
VQHKDSSSSSSNSSSSDSRSPVRQHSVRAPAHDAALSAAQRGSSSISPIRRDSKQVSAVPATAASQRAPCSNSNNKLSVSNGDDWRAFAKAALHSNSDVESACTVLTTCEQQQQQHSSRQQHTLLTAVDLLVSTST